ncbi:streptomycin biosynthesis regulator [Microbispora sp. NBC_01389]|uniref:streptomycin biosynthesis regulator n=1 Tax=Microbispora sp. NBC_01389 TaxID=2903584 RepID=UPI0032439314
MTGDLEQLIDADGGQVTMVAVDSLVAGLSPRKSGEDREHVLLLAAVPDELPPILVHYPTMRVIDGAHRLAAARLRGADHIAVRLFDGDEVEAFVLAVRANAAHGLPLSLSDRKAAAERILKVRPHWSDRYIASVAGISAKTVAEIRAAGAEILSPNARIGRDGRVRSVNAAEGRRIAMELIAENPEWSLRQIAKVAGISPETARDVRNKMRRQEDPVAGRRPRPQAPPVDDPDARDDLGELRQGIERLRSDPGLIGSPAGRALLRLLSVHLAEVERWKRLGERVPPYLGGVPPYWGDIVASLAFECGNIWDEFARCVQERVEETV